MNSIELGKLLKLSRQQKGLTQEQLAETLSVTTSAISKWENGKNLPDTDMLLKLALTLELSIEDLYYPEQTLARISDNVSSQTHIPSSNSSETHAIINTHKKRPKHFKLLLSGSIIISLLIITVIICYIYHEKQKLSIRPAAYRVVYDEQLNVEVYEVACIYSGSLDSPALDVFFDHEIIAWQNNSFIPENIIYQKMSLYKNQDDAWAWSTPTRSVYLVRHP